MREPRDRKKTIRKAVIMVIVAALVIYGGIYGYNLYSFGRIHVSTDDAQVDGHIDPVIAHVSGYVTSVNVADNDKVKEGDFIAEIDPRELKIKLEAAEDALKTAEAGLQTAQANFNAAQERVADLEQNVRMEVEQALADRGSSAQRIATADLQVRQATAALALARTRYTFGVITSLELLNAQTLLQEAEFARLQSQYNYTMSQYSLERAMGEKIW
ncbi:MAG: biotin/lipoyl-binding protein [Candidatus Kapaibacterium sp.]